IESAAADLGFDWVSGLDVVFRRSDNADIETASRADFRSLAQKGELGAETIIYERSPTTLGRMRSEGIATPASDTWTARYFRDRAEDVGNA
ncbi:MAG: hypothetical protein KJO98_08975, partial [Rhodothermia bacterium]|nr:hypothetical protein [Rhodothermia bacterium]